MKSGRISAFLLCLCLPLSAADVTFTFDTVVPNSASYDTVTVQSPGPLPTTVDFMGFAWKLNTHNNSVVNLSNGGGISIGDFPPTNLNISHLYDSSVVNIDVDSGFGGGSIAFLLLHQSSVLNINGGEVFRFLGANDNSTVNLYDGRLWSSGFAGNSMLNVYGGIVDIPFLVPLHDIDPTATVNIFGTGFVYNPLGKHIVSSELGLDYWVPKLTGTGQDDTSITFWGLPDPVTHDNINLIPEPATGLLLLLGMQCLRRKQREISLHLLRN